MSRKLFVQWKLMLLLFFLPTFVSAHVASADSISAVEEHQPQQEKFDPGKFIFDHIGDSYDWHICTVNGVHISIPLPIILYSQKSGLHIFMSSKFHHHGQYQNFRIESSGKYEGKIVELDETGAIDEVNPLPLEFSITKNVASILLICIFLCWIFISVAKKYQRKPNSAPSGLQNGIEFLVLFVRDEIVVPALGERRSSRFMPFLLTMFFFILFTNLLGLVPIFPGGANLTGNIAVTMVLATFTFLTVNLNGNKSYWRHIVDTPGVPWFMKIPVPIMPLVEIMGVFIKPIVLMIRLFANMLAGHMIVMVFMSLIFIFSAMQYWLGFAVAPISMLFAIFMIVLDILVSAIQAYVFTMLSAVYISMATEEHH